MAVFTAFLTAFYTGRAFFKTFWGPEKLPSPDDPEAPPEPAGHALAHHGDGPAAHDHGHGDHVGHESPPVMTYPLYVLAGATVLIGIVCFLSWPIAGTTGWFAAHLHKTFGFELLGHHEHGFAWLTALIGLGAGLGGIALAYAMYAEPSPLPARMTERLRPSTTPRSTSFEFDEAYDLLVVRPARAAAVVCGYFDDYLVDPLVIAVAKLPRLLGRGLLARYQNGLLQFYAGVSALCIALLIVIFLFL